MGTDARNLLRKLLRAEPTDRITAAEALCHPYFEDIHEQCPVVAQYLPRSMPAAPSFLELRADAWQPGQDFLARQPELNRKMWGILYDWLSVVSYKFKFVPRSLQLACDYMPRYLMDTPIERKRLQLLGIGALCLACKHEEVMIPNMNDFIYICDNAYPLEELMAIEVEMLSSLDAQLHMPTVDDMLLPKLVEIGAALALPEADTADTTSPLRQWLQCVTLIGQAHYPVVLHDPAVLARCVATLGALLWCGQTAEVSRPDNGRLALATGMLPVHRGRLGVPGRADRRDGADCQGAARAVAQVPPRARGAQGDAGFARRVRGLGLRGTVSPQDQGGEEAGRLSLPGGEVQGDEGLRERKVVQGRGPRAGGQGGRQAPRQHARPDQRQLERFLRRRADVRVR